MYTSAELLALNKHDVTVPRAVRKVIFGLRLWRPVRQRLHSQRTRQPVRPGRSRSADCKDVSVGCVNAQSLGNKAAMLCCSIVDERLDMLVITETWHENSSSAVLRRVTPSGFRCIDAARPIPSDTRVDRVDFQNYGGLAIIHRSSIAFQKRRLDCNVTTFEYLCGYAVVGDSRVVLLGIYRPGSQALSALFFDELAAVFEQLATYRCSVVVCGDFNVHVDEADDVHAVQLLQLLRTFGCCQHVAEPTHRAGHTLDLVITGNDTDVRNLQVGGFISDHALIRFTLPAKTLPSVAPLVGCRSWRRLSHDAFAADLAASRLCAHLDEHSDLSADELARLYDQVMTDLLDQHCPVIYVRHRSRATTPWFDADCRAARRRARVTERRFRRKRTDANKRAWTVKLKALRALYEEKNSSYWRSEISESSGNSKKLWRTFNGVLGDVSINETDGLSADDFATFFQEKVDSVRSSTQSTPLYDVPYRSTPTLEEWTVVTADEVHKLIGVALCKICQLDPAPTWLIKEMRGLLSPFVALLFNKSLATGCFPSVFKNAVVRPLLKKVELDDSQLKNYRPVSNLPFLSKLLERVVQNRLQVFLDSSDLMPRSQSAYRQYHSTETAVTKVYNDMLLAADGGQVTALCLLDLTAAFDTVDHDLLLLRLERQFGIHGVALQWFRSYLQGRSFRVIYGGSTSTTIHIACSVPQGSVLGPRLFILYKADLAEVVEKHNVNIHVFADDTQLYQHCHRREMTTTVRQLEQCLVDVSHWMSANRLKLNPEKTELLWAGSRYSQSWLGSTGLSLRMESDSIMASDHVRVLGVTFSSDLSLDKHVSNVCAACFFWLRQLRRVRRSLDSESVKILVHAFVIARVDYCNMILAGAPKSVTDRLQRVLNAAARLVSGTRKYDRGLSQILHADMHWLDVADRVRYKLAVTVHRCLHNKAPKYLADCCIAVSDIAGRQRLRSAHRRQLDVPRHHRSTLGRRAFSVAGPIVWNSLPDELRDNLIDTSFRRSLKTLFFSQY